ncbi:MAG: ZIP family metal transporter [Candidatus Helarchaeota archaeon]|nr:ZIP family metal transporter [Candidatus Helarchaeota archaeon]
MVEIWWILAATTLVSLISLIGIVTIGINDKFLHEIIILLVALSAGGLLGGGFLHLLPEAVLAVNDLSIYLWVIIGFILFFLIEKVLVYHHCHNVEHDHVLEFHAFKWLNLIGDSVHNFVDGLILAAAFLISIPLGITTTVAVIFHEIPQEIGDFGVLVYGGFSKKKALYLNFLTALIAVGGGITGFFVLSAVMPVTPFLLAFAAGGFFYIAASDLIPELNKEYTGKKTIVITLIINGGILMMWLFKLIFA